MQKTKLGISVGLLGAITYFAGLFGGYVVAILVFGYIMLVEDNPWLRKTAVKAIILLVTFSALSAVIGLVPDFISFINSIFNIFNEYLSLSLVTKILAVITGALGIVKTVVFLLLGIKALNQGTLLIPVVDDITNKNME